MTDHDRVAYLAGEPGAIVRPEERAGLDDLRTLLTDPAVWTEPYPELEDRVVAAVGAAAAGRCSTGRSSAAQAPNRHRQPGRRRRHRRRSPRCGEIRDGDGAVQSGTGWHHPQPGRLRGSDSDEDLCGMAGEPACYRAASVGQRALLRGLAKEPERRARPHRHFQPTKQHHFVGGSATDQFPRTYRYPPAGQRQSRFVGPSGPDRRGSTRSLTGGVGRCRAPTVRELQQTARGHFATFRRRQRMHGLRPPAHARRRRDRESLVGTGT